MVLNLPLKDNFWYKKMVRRQSFGNTFNATLVAFPVHARMESATDFILQTGLAIAVRGRDWRNPPDSSQRGPASAMHVKLPQVPDSGRSEHTQM